MFPGHITADVTVLHTATGKGEKSKLVKRNAYTTDNYHVQASVGVLFKTASSGSVKNTAINATVAEIARETQNCEDMTFSICDWVSFSLIPFLPASLSLSLSLSLSRA